MAWWNTIIPSKNDREIKKYRAKVQLINDREAQLKALPDAALQQKTGEFREKYERVLNDLGVDPQIKVSSGTREEIKAERKKIDQALDEILPDAFAVVRESARRVLGMRHYDVQMLGGMVLHEGRIAEMKTGEGKTLVATAPIYLNAITGRGAHVVTVNEYLATRDAQWMGQVYNFLGMGVGIIHNSMSSTERQQAYAQPITYGTNSEFGFDYLRDNMKLFLKDYAQRGHHFAIVDEVDSILIDEARTPLIISGPAESSTEKYIQVNGIIPGLRREQDYTVDEKTRSVNLTESGMHSVEKRLGVKNLYDPDNIELLHHVNQGLRAHTLYRRDVNYMVSDGEVNIIDEFTGRPLAGRRWSDGLHQAVEAKEGVTIQNENQTLATITYQNLFRMYMKLSGMTGTAETEAEEFQKIYELDCVVVPTNKPIARIDSDDKIYGTEMEKFAAIAEDIQERSMKGQPILVGTVSVERSEVLSKHLKRLKIPHEVLNAKFHAKEATIVAQAGRKSVVTIATNMAGRGTDILLGGNPEFLANLELQQKYGGEEIPENELAQTLERYRTQCEREKQEVLDAGGLHIVGTERHESRRIDNQLRGRAGRQGDPGSSLFYLSLEDDLMRIFGGERLKGLMERFGMKEGEVIEHPWVNKSVENAQKKVEGNNFDIRKHLLDYDDVMNDQRKAVYKLRRDVIGASPEISKEMMLDLCDIVVQTAVERSCPPKTGPDEWNLDGLKEACLELFNTKVDFENIEEASRQGLENRIFDLVEAHFNKRAEGEKFEQFWDGVRVEYLKVIDTQWKEHLRDMDHLREGINLRGYAQKDPKHEYKKEGFGLFDRMMASVRDLAVFRSTHIEVLSREEVESRLMEMDAKRKSESNEGLRRPRAEKKKATPVKRASPKLQPNEPCHCGSGKKYKKCHMHQELSA